MSTYSAITNAQIDAESYYDTVLAAQNRDNHLAIIEGDATASAHRIQSAAFDDGEIATVKLAGYPWTYSDLSLTGSLVGADLAAFTVGRGKIKSSAKTTISGTLGATALLNVALTESCYFPMIHTDDPSIYITGHSTDGGNADNPRFGLYNSDGSGHNYDIDYRNIDV